MSRGSPLAHIERSLGDCGFAVRRDGSFLLHTLCRRGAGSYGVHFGFLDSVCGVQVTAIFNDLVVPQERCDDMSQLVMRLNNYLWLGSLSLERASGVISYRHTVVDSQHSFRTATKLDAYMDHLLNECERIRPAFDLSLRGGCDSNLAFDAIMLDTVGSC